MRISKDDVARSCQVLEGIKSPEIFHWILACGIADLPKCAPFRFSSLARDAFNTGEPMRTDENDHQGSHAWAPGAGVGAPYTGCSFSELQFITSGTRVKLNTGLQGSVLAILKQPGLISCHEA